MNSLQLVQLTKKENIKNGSLWFVTEIATSKKSMMLMTLKHQNWVESLSGNENEATNLVIALKSRFNVSFA